MTSHSIRTVVRYGETDQMGIAHHANYLIYFELGRSAMMKERGCSYGDLEKSGTILPVTEAHCRFRASACYEDEIEITTYVEKVTAARVRFRYEIHRVNDGLLLTEGYTVLGCLGKDRKAKRIPEAFAKALLA